MKKCLIWAIVFMLVFSFASSVVAKETIEIGDYVLMGTYYGKPILWRCIDIDENGPLMFSDKIICIKAFDAKGESGGTHQRGHYYKDEKDGETKFLVEFERWSGSENWADSNMRSWLNSTASAGNVVWICGNAPVSTTNPYANEAGFLSNFTTKERVAMKTVEQKSVLSYGVYDNVYRENFWRAEGNKIGLDNIVGNYDTAYSEMVTDTMFLIDVKQLEAARKNLGLDYICISKTTEECRANSNREVGEKYSYRIRTGDTLGNPTGHHAATFNVSLPYEGYSSYPYLGVSSPSAEGGVRPAFYLNTEEIYFRDGDGSESMPYTLKGGIENSDSQVADIEYELEGGVLTIKGEGEMEDYKSTVPAPWSLLSDSVTEIVVEKGITYIGNQAFAKFSNLKTISLPESLLSIGNYAFANCTSLETVNMYGVTEAIGTGTFNGCENLANVNINGTFDDYKALNIDKNNLPFERANIIYTHENGNVYASMSIYARWAYDTETKTLVISNYPHVASRDMVNYKTTASVPWNAYIDEIEKVEVNGVASLGSYSLLGSTSVKTAFVDDIVKKINSWAFFKCTNLETVKLGSSITAIGTGAFNGTDSLKLVEFNNTKSNYDNITFGKSNNSIMRTTTTLTDGVTGYQGGKVYWNLKDGVLTLTGTGAMTSIPSAEDAPWYNYRNEVTKIVIEDGITNVAKNAFNNFENLETVEIGEGVTTLGVYAFKNSSVKMVYLPSTFTTVGTSAFNGCNKLSEIVYSGTPEAFEGITIGSGNTRFSNATKSYIVKGTYGNIAYTINRDVLTLSGTGAMRSVSSFEETPWYPFKDIVKTIVVEDGITTIAAYAFSDFTALKRLELGNTMRTIGSYAFQNSKIELIGMYKGFETVGYYAFASCSEIKLCIVFRGSSEEFSAITVRPGNQGFTGAANSFV